MDELTLRRVLAESGRGTVRDMMAFLDQQHEGEYDPQLAHKVAEDLCSEMQDY